jgi:hypothetical protein
MSTQRIPCDIKPRKHFLSFSLVSRRLVGFFHRYFQSNNMGDDSGVAPLALGNRCYVGNLAWATTTEALTEHFGAHGALQSANVMRDDGGAISCVSAQSHARVSAWHSAALGLVGWRAAWPCGLS